MRKIFIILNLIIAAGNIYAQKDLMDISADEAYMNSMRAGVMGMEYINPVPGYKGNQYLGFWTVGEIILTNGERITDLNLRYERYLDELLWLRDDFITGIIYKGSIVGFRLLYPSEYDTAVFIKKRLKLPFTTDSTDCFLQNLEPGTNSLCVYRKVIKIKDTHELTDETRYYIFNHDQVELIRLKRHDLLNVAFIDKMKMKSLLKSNKIALRGNERQFALALKLYNQQF
jgi:hypothetical protein